MARQARVKSKTGIYHVMYRGINQQQIFEDTEDYEKYLQVLNDYKAVSGYKILAYCLMGNHMHLLIKEELETLEQIFKRVGGRYVYWYNTKYKRTGHLFQDRFQSEPINDDAYLSTVLRYIHQNPVKAHLVKYPQEYRWSSYREFLAEHAGNIIDAELILTLMSRAEFKTWNSMPQNDSCLEVHDRQIRLTDEDARKMLKKLCGCETATEFQALEVKRRDGVLRELKATHISIRQASRLTGISKGVIEKYFKT